MSKNAVKFISVVYVLLLILSFAVQAYAADPPVDVKQEMQKVVGGDASMDEEQVRENITGAGNSILRIVILVVGFIFVGLLIYAAVKISTSVGNSRQTSSGFSIIIGVLLGIFIAASAPSIYSWVVGFALGGR